MFGAGVDAPAAVRLAECEAQLATVKAFGQAGTGMASREAYLIDRSGRIVYHDEKQTEKQAEKVLEFLASKKS